MTVDEIKKALFRCAGLTFPRLQGLEPGQKVELVEDYLVETAIARSELERARLYMHEAHHALLRQWDDIQGWQAHVGWSSRTTQDDIRLAKKEINPGLYASMVEAKFLIDRLGQQIARLELDDKAASRAYTIITGS